MQFTTDNIIFLVSILLIVGVLTTKFSSRLGLPSLVFYIAVGMVLSQFIYYDNAHLTQLFGIFALIVILFEGGMQTQWNNVKSVIKPSLSLATLGVLLTTAVIGVCAKFILGVSWLEGFLFGAIVGSTDAAAVFAVLGGMNIKKRLSSTLEAESGTNDPMAVFLTISFIQLIQMEKASILMLAWNFVLQMGLGLILGWLLGKLAVRVLNRINLDSSGLYPVLALAFAVMSYSATALLGGSGLLAVYVMAMLVGNSDITYRHSIFRFNEGFAWMAQILMFILLGLLVFPGELLVIKWQGIVLAILLMFVARPIGVFISTLFTRFTLKEKVFISWAGLRGAVPIVLATYPLVAGVPNGQLFFDVVFFVVLSSALIQGATISPLAKKLGLVGERKPTVPHSLELVSIGQTNTEIIQITVEEQSGVSRKEIRQLRLPEDILITAIIREDQIVTPRGNTRILPEDILYVIVPKMQKERIKEIFLKPPETEEAATADGLGETQPRTEMV
jgi:cell volume regulation protein A